MVKSIIIHSLYVAIYFGLIGISNLLVIYLVAVYGIPLLLKMLF